MMCSVCPVRRSLLYAVTGHVGPHSQSSGAFNSVELCLLPLMLVALLDFLLGELGMSSLPLALHTSTELRGDKTHISDICNSQ